MDASLVTHVEWATTNTEQLTKFLSGLFGWKFAAFGENYFICDPEPGKGVSIGVLQSTETSPGGTPNVYIKVDSVDDSIVLAQELGGQMAVPKTEIPGMGAYAFVSAPEGNLIGLHESLKSDGS